MLHIFMEGWYLCNASNLINMLQCFFLSSGLKIDVHKSKLLGIGVFVDDITEMSSVLGCRASTLTLIYLGVLVGCNMVRIVN